MERCNLCGKDEKIGNSVFYSKEEYILCRSDYLKWLIHHKPYREKHKKINPGTKAWSKMCKEEERLFKKWFKEQKKEE